MKNVLVLVHDDSGQESRLRAAIDATRALNGHLIGVNVAIMPSTEFDRGLDAERVTEAKNRQIVEQRLTRESVSWHLREAEDYVESAIMNACDLADLIVVNNEAAELRPRSIRRAAGVVAIRSRKPLLAAPKEGKRFDATGEALVAWDGSDPAMAVVTAAVPLLQIAQSVTLYEVDDESITAPAEEAAAYLSRHGIKAEIIRDQSPPRMVDDLLLEKAKSGRFSYVIMGAYSRPRVIESLFGGVTKRMLRDSPVPLLIAH